MPESPREDRPLHPVAAGALVFGVSGAVLVLEILAARLLAPYVGLSLETYTAIIGVVLAGISLGTWLGGRVADAIDPRRILGPLLILGGLLSLATLPGGRGFGELAQGRSAYALVLAVLFSFFPPAAVLSAASPLVVKLQLRSLTVTGHVVGRLSALGTAGAIVGTFLTGFVLLPAFPTSGIVIVLGSILVAIGCVLTAMRRRRLGLLSASVLAAAALALVGAAGPSRCDVETAYFCAKVEREGQSGRVLRLDDLSHSHVDLEDPTVLVFPYVQVLGDFADVFRPKGSPIAMLSIGGGGFTLPRYVAATRPGSRNDILELDSGVVRISKERLGFKTGPLMRVHTGDARGRLRDVPRDSFDLAIGDAFSGSAIPWHLATEEAAEEVLRILRPGGTYGMNIIDRPSQDLVRAEVRTVQQVFRHVALVAPRDLIAGRAGGNYVLLASDSELPLGRLEAHMVRRRNRNIGHGPQVVVAGSELKRFVGDAVLLTDDYAPADQLLTR